MYEEVLQGECGYNGTLPYVLLLLMKVVNYLIYRIAVIGTGHKTQTN